MEAVDFNYSGHILDCDFVYNDLPCNCDGRPTAFWVSSAPPGAPERKPNWLLAKGYRSKPAETYERKK